MSRWERGAILLTPAVAIATLAIGLRIGASPGLRAAVVYGAPPAAAHLGLAWQVVTLVEDRGVLEADRLARVSVFARAKGLESRWDGSTNADGVAEVWLDLPGILPGDPIEIEVRAPNEALPLAAGLASWSTAAPREAPAERALVRPSKQDGELEMEVGVYGGRLAPGFASSLWVQVTDRSTKEAVAGAVVDAEPEPGLTVQSTRVVSNTDGYAELVVRAEIHVVGLALRASAAHGPWPRGGAWYGSVPVAPGAFFVAMPFAISPRERHAFDVLVPTVAPRVYAEVDDAQGRAFAASIEVERSHVEVAVPPLFPGTYWLVTAAEPRGAESLRGSALARPVFVAEPPKGDRMNLGPRLAMLAPPRFSRFVALDGLPGKRRAIEAGHLRGLAIALGALGVAAALEAMLILRVVARSKRRLARLAEAFDENGASVDRGLSGVSVAMGVLVALLGFALLAALLAWRAS